MIKTIKQMTGDVARHNLVTFYSNLEWGWSGGAMVLGKLPVPVRLTNFDQSRARAFYACSRCRWEFLDIFSLIYYFSFLSPSLWETARYRLKYCLQGPLSPKQPNNQPTNQSNLECNAYFNGFYTTTTTCACPLHFIIFLLHMLIIQWNYTKRIWWSYMSPKLNKKNSWWKPRLNTSTFVRI